MRAEAGSTVTKSGLGMGSSAIESYKWLTDGARRNRNPCRNLQTAKSWVHLRHSFPQQQQQLSFQQVVAFAVPLLVESEAVVLPWPPSSNE